MDRRGYLLASAALTTGTAGCDGVPPQSGESGEISVVDSKKVEGQVVEQSATPPEYTARIENTGITGELRAGLYWNPGEEQSEAPAATTTVVIESGARRSVTLSADRPASADTYGFRLRSIDFAAEVQNTGAETTVRAQFLQQPSGTVRAETERVVPGGETATVEFHIPDGYAGEYEIRALTKR
jgi:hypothetical protein